MARAEHKEFVTSGAAADIANTLVGFLDPHLESSSQARTVVKEERWPLRKAFLFIGGVSLMLWAVILSILLFLFGL